MTRQRFHVRPAVGRRLLFLASAWLAWGAVPLHAGRDFIFQGVGLLPEEATVPLPVLAGQPAEFVLRLTVSGAAAPALTVDLAAVAGNTTTPLVSGQSVELKPDQPAKGNAQRFRFTLDIPAAARRQRLLLRLHVLPVPGETALLLPPVWLEALPSTWKETLQHFARDLPLGRLAGNENLDHLLAAAEIEAAVLESDTGPLPTGPRVWLAARATDGEIVLPDSGEALWIVFQPNVGRACRIKRAGRSLVIVADARALQLSVQPDGVGQEILEQALASARTLLSVPSPTSP